MTPRVRTERLLLREWREADKLPYSLLNADPEVMRHFPSTLTREQSDEMVERMAAAWELRGFGLWDIDPDEVKFGFREVVAASPSCTFADCGHESEPGCAVRAAVEAGEIDEERFESFKKLREEVKAEAAQRLLSRRR